MNFVQIAGHLGADPEVRFTSSGQKVTTLRVAARCRKSGSEDLTIWWRVTLWGEQWDKLISYLKKGSSVIVFGDLNKPEIFTDRDGKPQISMSITAFNVTFSPFGRTDKHEENKPAASNAAPHSAVSEDSEAFAGFATGAQPSDHKNMADDEIPF